MTEETLIKGIKMAIPQEDIYNFLNRELSSEYTIRLQKIRPVKDAVQHPGKAPIKKTHQHAAIESTSLIETIREIFSIKGIERDSVKIRYSPACDEHTVKDEDWPYNDKTGEEEYIQFDRVVPARIEMIYLDYTIKTENFDSLLRQWNNDCTAHEQSAKSRRENIEKNSVVESENRRIISAARNKNIELWRSVAKSLANGETPDIKNEKRKLLLAQLEALVEEVTTANNEDQNDAT